VVEVDPHRAAHQEVHHHLLVLASLRVAVEVSAQKGPLRVLEVTVPLLLHLKQVIRPPPTAIMEQLSQHQQQAIAQRQPLLLIAATIPMVGFTGTTTTFTPRLFSWTITICITIITSTIILMFIIRLA
jgi:hypothetical protein